MGNRKPSRSKPKPGPRFAAEFGPNGQISITPTRELTAPEQSFPADLAWAELRHGAVRLLFGRLVPGEGLKLDWRIEFRYSIDAFVTFFWNQATATERGTTFMKSVDEFRDRTPNPFFDRPPISNPSSMNANRELCGAANYLNAAFNGSEAQLDFYWFPVVSLRNASLAQDPSLVRIEPVATIILTTHELARLHDDCRRVKMEIEEQIVGARADGVGGRVG